MVGNINPRASAFNCNYLRHAANRGARYSGMFTKAPSFLRLRSENRIANFGFLELTYPLKDDARLSPPALTSTGTALSPC